MSKLKIQDEWEKLSYEITQDKPDINGAYPPNIVKNRELLLFAQAELEKIESGKNIAFHKEIYQKIMKRYFQQKMSEI